MHNNNRLRVRTSNSLDQIISIMPRGQILPVALVSVDGDIILARIGVDEDDGDFGGCGGAGGLRDVPVVEVPRHGGVVFAGAGLDGFEGLYHIIYAVVKKHIS